MKKYALIIVDMQNDFVLTEKTAVKGAKATIPAIKNAMRICHEKHIPVFHVIRAYDTNGDNAEIFRKSLFQKGQGVCIAGPRLTLFAMIFIRQCLRIAVPPRQMKLQKRIAAICKIWGSYVLIFQNAF